MIAVIEVVVGSNRSSSRRSSRKNCSTNRWLIHVRIHVRNMSSAENLDVCKLRTLEVLCSGGGDLFGTQN